MAYSLTLTFCKTGEDFETEVDTLPDEALGDAAALELRAAFFWRGNFADELCAKDNWQVKSKTNAALKENNFRIFAPCVESSGSFGQTPYVVRGDTSKSKDIANANEYLVRVAVWQY
jgi:hypothetical protein